MARWGISRQPPNPRREPTRLAGFSPYRRHTPHNSYADGATLFSELDHLFSQSGGSGLRPLLNALYNQKKLHQITTEFFKTFLESRSGHNLGQIFDRFVYGRGWPEILRFERRVERRSRPEAIIRAYEADAPQRVHARGTERITLKLINAWRRSEVAPAHTRLAPPHEMAGQQVRRRLMSTSRAQIRTATPMRRLSQCGGHLIVVDRPGPAGPGFVQQASTRSLRKRRRHLPTVCSCTPNSAATTLLGCHRRSEE